MMAGAQVASRCSQCLRTIEVVLILQERWLLRGLQMDGMMWRQLNYRIPQILIYSLGAHTVGHHATTSNSNLRGRLKLPLVTQLF
jgi:hypothetical protein